MRGATTGNLEPGGGMSGVAGWCWVVVGGGTLDKPRINVNQD